MGELVVPTLNSNDDTYTLVEWLVPAAAQVATGDTVATIETSKAVNDLTVDEDGYLSQCVGERTECRPGDVVGRVWSMPQQAAAAAPAHAPAAEAPGPEGSDPAAPVVTRPALELLEKHDIPLAAVAALGKSVIKRTDVEALVSAATDSSREELSAHQRAVARTVARSHATIPDAFVVVKVAAEHLQRRQREIAESHRSFVGFPEQVVKAAGALHASFPRLFCAVDGDLSLDPAPRADIGVTVDVGTGLFVPVVRDVANLTVPDIAARLMEFRVRAMRGKLTDADLAGSRMTIALHVDPGIVMAKPIIFPGQVCTLSLTSRQSELRLADDGAVVAQEYFHIGLAYDHRIINGRDAVRFLLAMREALESGS